MPTSLDMQTHKINILGKSVTLTDKTIFRVEESRNAKCTYEGVYAHKDPVSVIRYYNSTCEADRKAGFRVRLVKDGDEFSVISKKTF
jgi:hypothetical protein